MRDAFNGTRWVALLGLLTAIALSSCAEAPTAPQPDDAALEALLAEGGDGGRGGEGRGPFLGRLLGHALTQLGEQAGPEAVQDVRERLAPLHAAVEEARAAGDREAYRRATLALETQASQIVVRILGPTVVRRVLGHASDRLTQLSRRVREAQANGHDVSAAVAVLRQASATLDEARSAAQAGDLPGALRLSARALDVLGG